MIRRTETGVWAVFFLIAGITAWSQLPHVPYRDVDVLASDTSDGEMLLVATFEKTDCEFQQLVAVGGFLGQTRFLDWRDGDGLGPDYDRENGRQTLRILVDDPGDLDWIEIRTRHDCDGEKVDKIFARIDMEPGE